MKGDWTKWSAISEMVGAAAIVLSLIFVGLQIRANTKATQGATFQDHMGYEIQFLMDVASSEQGMQGWLTKWEDLETAGDVASETKILIAVAEMRLWEGFYLQYRNGTMSQEGWEARENLIRRRVGIPPAFVFDDSFSGEFLDFVSSVRSDMRTR